MADICNQLSTICVSYNQDNIDILKVVNISQNSYESTKQDVIDAVNALDTYIINEIQSLWIDINFLDLVTFRYKVINHGKGTYGSGGTPLIYANLHLVEASKITDPDELPVPLELQDLQSVLTEGNVATLGFDINSPTNQFVSVRPLIDYGGGNVVPTTIIVGQDAPQYTYTSLTPGKIAVDDTTVGDGLSFEPNKLIFTKDSYSNTINVEGTFDEDADANVILRNVSGTIALLEDMVVPTLQSVLNEGNVSTLNFLLDAVDNSEHTFVEPGLIEVFNTDGSIDTIIEPGQIRIVDSTNANIVTLTPDGVNFSPNNDVYKIRIEVPTLTLSDKVAQLQDASGTIAYLSDIPSPIEGFIPLTGTELGDPISGDLEFDGGELYRRTIDGDDNDIINEFMFMDNGNILIARNNETLSNTSIIRVQEDNILIQFEDNVDAKGLSGNIDFSNNITNLDYVQKIYVDNQLNNKADDDQVVHLTGDETIAGIKTFTSSLSVDGAVKLSNDSTNGAGKIESLGTDIELHTSDGVIFRGVISGGNTFFQVGGEDSSTIFSAKNGTYFDTLKFNSVDTDFDGGLSANSLTVTDGTEGIINLPTGYISDDGRLNLVNDDSILLRANSKDIIFSDLNLESTVPFKIVSNAPYNTIVDGGQIEVKDTGSTEKTDLFWNRIRWTNATNKTQTLTQADPQTDSVLSNQMPNANGQLVASLSGSAILDFGTTSTQESNDLTITVTGAVIGDIIALGTPVVPDNSCYTAFVSATDTVTVRFNNYSGSSIDPASGTFKIKILR